VKSKILEIKIIAFLALLDGGAVSGVRFVVGDRKIIS